jgi:hypothetical protein
MTNKVAKLQRACLVSPVKVGSSLNGHNRSIASCPSSVQLSVEMHAALSMVLPCLSLLCSAHTDSVLRLSMCRLR